MKTRKIIGLAFASLGIISLSSCDNPLREAFGLSENNYNYVPSNSWIDSIIEDDIKEYEPSNEKPNENYTPAVIPEEKNEPSVSPKKTISILLATDCDKDLIYDEATQFLNDYGYTDYEIKLRSLDITKVLNDPYFVEGSDLIMFDSYYADALYSKNYLEYIQFPNEVRERDYASAIDAVSRDGGIYGYPYSVTEACVMYYNSSIMNGVDMTDLSMIIERCKETNTKIAMNLNDMYYANMFFAGGGTKVKYIEDNNQLVGYIDTFMGDCDNGYAGIKELVDSGVLIWSNDPYYLAQDASVLFTGTWARDFSRECLGVNYEVSPLPWFKAQDTYYNMSSFLNMNYIGICKNQSPIMRMLNKLANYITSYDFQMNRLKSNLGATNIKASYNANRIDNALFSMNMAVGNGVPLERNKSEWFDFAKFITEDLPSLYDIKVLYFYTMLDEPVYCLIGGFQGNDSWDKDYIFKKINDDCYYIHVDFTKKSNRYCKIVFFETEYTIAGYDELDSSAKNFLYDNEYREDNSFNMDKQNVVIYYYPKENRIIIGSYK